MTVSTWSKRLILTTAATLATSQLALAAESPATKPAAKPAAPAAAPKMSAEDQAMMEAWTKFMTPGEHHKAMAGGVGTWNTTTSMWMKPGAPPEVTHGTAVTKLIFDGRYMVEDFQGTAMGMPFTGHGLNGFDNQLGKHVGTWIDNFGTGIMTTVGTCDADHKTINFAATGSDVMSKTTRTWRGVTHEDNANKHTFTMYDKGPDGKEWKMMEIVYERAM